MKSLFGPHCVAGALLGTRGGHVLLIDVQNRLIHHSSINRASANGDDVSSASFLLFERSLRDVGADAPTTADNDAIDDSEVRCVSLDAQSTARAAFPTECTGVDALCVSGLVWLTAASAVAVGYRCGIALAVSLPSKRTALVQLLSGAALGLPVTSFAYQALTDDTLAFIWVGSGAATASGAGGSGNDKRTAKPTAVVFSMYQLQFAAATTTNGGSTNDNDVDDKGTDDAKQQAEVHDDDDDDDEGAIRNDISAPKSTLMRHQRLVSTSGSILLMQVTVIACTMNPFVVDTNMFPRKALTPVRSRTLQRIIVTNCFCS